jgi:hypothetical protein
VFVASVLIPPRGCWQGSVMRANSDMEAEHQPAMVSTLPTAGPNPQDAVTGAAPIDCLVEHARGCSGFPAARGCMAMEEKETTTAMVSAAVTAAVAAAVAVAEEGHRRLLAEAVSWRDEAIHRMADEISSLRAAATTSHATASGIAVDVGSTGRQWSGRGHDSLRCWTAAAVTDSDGTTLEDRVLLPLLVDTTAAHAQRLPAGYKAESELAWLCDTAESLPPVISVAPSPPRYAASSAAVSMPSPLHSHKSPFGATAADKSPFGAAAAAAAATIGGHGEFRLISSALVSSGYSRPVAGSIPAAGCGTWPTPMP